MVLKEKEGLLTFCLFNQISKRPYGAAVNTYCYMRTWERLFDDVKLQRIFIQVN